MTYIDRLAGVEIFHYGKQLASGDLTDLDLEEQDPWALPYTDLLIS